MSNYARGYRFERRTYMYLALHGFVVVRSAGSHGLVDLVALKRREVVLVQCKLRGAISTADWNALVEMAERIDAIPVMARMPGQKRTGLEFLRFTGPKERRGHMPCVPWSPEM